MELIPLLEADNVTELRTAVEANRDVLSQEVLNATVLHYACTEGANECVRWLVGQPEVLTTIDRQDADSATALCWAAGEGHVQVVQLLLRAGANVNVPDDPEKDTPLHWAALPGHTTVVRELLDNGAKVNALGVGSLTALHSAVMNGHGDCVCALLDGGADPEMEDASGRTAVVLAKEMHGDALAGFFDPAKRHLVRKVDMLSARVTTLEAELAQAVSDRCNTEKRLEDYIRRFSDLELRYRAEREATHALEELLKEGSGARSSDGSPTAKGKADVMDGDASTAEAATAPATTPCVGTAVSATNEHVERKDVALRVLLQHLSEAMSVAQDALSDGV